MQHFECILHSLGLWIFYALAWGNDILKLVPDLNFFGFIYFWSTIINETRLLIQNNVCDWNYTTVITPQNSYTLIRHHLVSCSLWLEQHVPTSEEAAKRVKNKTNHENHEHMKKTKKYEVPTAFGSVGYLGFSPVESYR